MLFTTQAMTAYALQRKLGRVGITVSSVHPGFVSCFRSYLLQTPIDWLTFNSQFCRWELILSQRLPRTARLGPTCTKPPEFFLHVSCQTKHFLVSGMKFDCWFVSLAMTREPTEGAATSINCAVNPELNSQQCFYYDSCQVKQSSADSRYAFLNTHLHLCSHTHTHTHI